MRVILVWLVVLAACNEGAARVVRWPEHRHHHDDQLDRLQVTVEAQRQEIAELQRRVLVLESAAGRTNQPHDDEGPPSPPVKVDTAPRP